MAKQFVEGNKYVFSAKKFKNHMGKKKYETNKCWVNESNGRAVTIESSVTGGYEYYGIVPQWCKCIENNQGRL